MSKNVPARTPQNSGSPPVKPDDSTDFGLPYPLNEMQEEVETRVTEAVSKGDLSEIWKRDHDRYPRTSSLYELSYKLGDKVSSLANWFRGKNDPSGLRATERTSAPAQRAAVASGRSIREAVNRGRKKPE